MPFKRKANPYGGYALIAKPGEGGTAAPSNLVYRGQWTATPPSPYLTNELVIVLSGAAAGTYLNLTDNNTNNPATGNGWVQIAPGDAYGRWQ